MSKDRARARAQREALALASARSRVQAAQRTEARTGDRQRRRSGRQELWRRMRLWQNGPGSGRNRERWSALVVGVLVALLLTYLLTSSWTAVLAGLLVTVIAIPALIALVSDRSSR